MEATLTQKVQYDLSVSTQKELDVPIADTELQMLGGSQAMLNDF
jgi:hypothetical protein